MTCEVPPTPRPSAERPERWVATAHRDFLCSRYPRHSRYLFGEKSPRGAGAMKWVGDGGLLPVCGALSSISNLKGRGVAGVAGEPVFAARRIPLPRKHRSRGWRESCPKNLRECSAATLSTPWMLAFPSTCMIERRCKSSLLPRQRCATHSRTSSAHRQLLALRAPSSARPDGPRAKTASGRVQMVAPWLRLIFSSCISTFSGCTGSSLSLSRGLAAGNAVNHAPSPRSCVSRSDPRVPARRDRAACMAPDGGVRH